MKKLPVFLENPTLDPQHKIVVKLKEKFIKIVHNQTVNPFDAERHWQKILAAHRDSSRHYHNLSHLYSITEVLDQFGTSDLNQSILYWSTFYHDYIYKATRKDNESKSAQLAGEILSGILPQREVENITTMIDSTARHEPLVDIPEQYIFLDADLAVLATEPKVYDRYARAIRKEYRIYPDLLYRPGRKKVLKHFLERTTIYYSTAFSQYEGRARANLRREMENLG